ncbi:hypothetical protein Hanom_Chr04g00359241 [Helianthus anomalus]
MALTGCQLHKEVVPFLKVQPWLYPNFGKVYFLVSHVIINL